MRIYYAHCVALYGTPQERRDVYLLQALGLEEVVNPNSFAIADRVAVLKRIYRLLNDGQLVGLDSVYTLAEIDEVKRFIDADPGKDDGSLVMELVFQPLVASCDALAFRALPDGRVPAGVAKEIRWAEESNKPIIELPSNLPSREMSVAATRQYLREVGQR